MSETATSHDRFIKAAESFRILSYVSRLAILSHLGNADESLSVGRVQAAVGFNQDITSRHLSHMRRAGLVAAEQVRTERRYRLTDAGLESFAMLSRFNAL